MLLVKLHRSSDYLDDLYLIWSPRLSILKEVLQKYSAIAEVFNIQCMELASSGTQRIELSHSK